MELFDDLEVAHDRMARVCGRLSSLSNVLSPAQLIMVLKATIRPMLQVNAVQKYLDTPMVAERKVHLPDNRGEWIKITMILDPGSENLKKEKANSGIWLHAVTHSYRILRMFTNGTTQKDMQERHKVRPKQLSLCIMGKSYLSGIDNKSLVKKRKAEGDDGHTSKKSRGQQPGGAPTP